ncbi:serine hydrolase domain-containing protein [Kordiimonas sp.]|uniref:serine hydrolase domain-containing protein n=1 Tax=Kordiimonas sp. TaxID=1970157 RepID=UPI003A8FD9DB
MMKSSNVKHLLAAVLLSGISSVTTAGIAEDHNGTAEATAAEAALSFRDLTLLEKAYITTKPEVRDGTTPVGELGVDAGEAAGIVKLAEEIAAGTYGRYDSLLVAHKDKLLFESYFRRGRINLAHPQASATKGYTSLILGRAIELGYLSMADLDKPLISFLKDIDRTNLAEGAEKITLHKALTMHGGLSVSDEVWEELQKTPEVIKGQRLVQALLERSGPITAEAQVYKYGNFNPMLVMAVVDAVVPGTVEDFIKTEVLGKLGITNYSWDKHPSGLPQAGWMVSITSRDMLKFGSVVLNEGKWNGEQLIPAAYLAKATSGLVKPTQDWMPESYRYGYFWYHKPVKVGGKSYDATLAWGGGDQRVIVVDALDLVIVFTGHDNEGTLMDQIEATVLPAFAK